MHTHAHVCTRVKAVSVTDAPRKLPRGGAPRSAALRSEARGGRARGRRAQRGLAASSLPFQVPDHVISASVSSFMNLRVVAPPLRPDVGMQRGWAHVPPRAACPWPALRGCGPSPLPASGAGRSQAACSLQSCESRLGARKVFGDRGIVSRRQRHPARPARPVPTAPPSRPSNLETETCRPRPRPRPLRPWAPWAQRSPPSWRGDLWLLWGRRIRPVSPPKG